MHKTQEKFTPEKIHNLAYYLIQKRKQCMGNIELMKLFYLIDVEFYKLFGETLTNAKYERFPKGPFASEILEKISELDGYEIAIEIIPTFSPFSKKGHRVGTKARFTPQLSETEKAVVDSVLEKTEKLPPLELEKVSYETEPMRHIIALEEKSKERPLRLPVDFSLIKRNSLMEKWISNKQKAFSRIKDEEYQEFLQNEKKELELAFA